jgi:hypothetical protein
MSMFREYIIGWKTVSRVVDRKHQEHGGAYREIPNGYFAQA